MGLLDPAVFEQLNKLKGLLGETPIGRYVRGQDQGVSAEGLLGAMRAMPVFDQQAAMGDMRYAADAIGPAAIAGTLKVGKAAKAGVKTEDIWYHGSPADIYGSKDGWFRLSEGESGVPVVWGVRDPFAAEGYARGEISFEMNPQTGKFPLTKSWYPDMSGGGVYSLKSTAKNPLEYDAGGKQWFKVPQGKILREAKDAGHDAVIFKNIADNYSSGSNLTSDVIAWLNTKAMEMAPGE